MKARRINFLNYFYVFTGVLFVSLFLAVDLFGLNLFHDFIMNLDFGFPAIPKNVAALEACGLPEHARKFKYATNFSWLIFFGLLPFLFLLTFLYRSFHHYDKLNRSYPFYLALFMIFIGSFIVCYGTFSCENGMITTPGPRVGWMHFYFFSIMTYMLFFLSSVMFGLIVWNLKKIAGGNHE